MFAHMPIIRDIVFGAVQRGARLMDLCGALDIAPDELHDSSIKVPFDRACRAWEHAIRLTKDNLLGLHIGESSTPSIMGMVGLLMQNSENLLTAFEKVSEFSLLATDMFYYNVQKSGREIALIYQPAPAWTRSSPVGARHAVEQAMSGTLQVFFLLAGRKINPTGAAFKHKRAGTLDEYIRVFGNEVRFNAKSNQLTFDRTDLLTPVVGYDRSLFAVFDKMLKDKKSEKNLTLTENIQRILVRDFQGSIPSLELIAARMNMTPRTIQRRLKEEGLTFRGVLGSIQQQLANELFKVPGTTATSVAQLLGYSDASAFRRARRQWK